MSEIPAMVKELIDAGTPPEKAAEIVAQAFALGLKSSARRQPKEAAYTPDFDEWWMGYPRLPTMSKKEAFSAWLKLKPEQREQAKGALPAYKEYLLKYPDCPVVHACRYLSQRRFEGFAKRTISDSEASVFVRNNEPRWEELALRYMVEKKTWPPVNRDGGWYFPREWFPTLKLVEPA